jgi:AraC-like DNA-binding protein
MWEYPSRLRTRLDAERYFQRRYPTGFKGVRIGEEPLRELEPYLDALVDLTEAGQVPEQFLRVLALFYTVLQIIDPFLDSPEDALPARAVAGDRPILDGLTRRRPLRRLRPEVSRVVELLESDLARSWRMDELAAPVGLSRGHLRRLFVEGLGVTPLTYQNQRRALRAQDLLADPDRTIPEVMAEVGWTTPGHWTTMFRRHTGMTPREYRNRA